jgi:hypothetical protein
VATYVYRLGPCNGRTVSYTPALADGRVVGCGGASYQFNAGNPGVLIWLDPGPSGGGGGASVDTRQVGRAWHKMTHALGVDGPAAIRRSAAARRRLRRAVR